MANVFITSMRIAVSTNSDKEATVWTDARGKGDVYHTQFTGLQYVLCHTRHDVAALPMYL